MRDNAPDTLPTYAHLAEGLQRLRRSNGNPSFTTLVDRIAAVRESRGVSSAESRPGRVTVYDCFRPDRRRVDVELVVDIVRALGADDVAVKHWEDAVWALQHRVDAARLVSVRDVVPLPPWRFAGRATELDALIDADAPTVQLVHGMAGSGKSELVFEAARRLIDSGRVSGVVVADLRGFDPDRPPADPGAAVGAIIRTLGADPLAVPTAERPRLLSDLLTDHRHLLILDDVASQAQFTGIVPTDAATPVLLTSRLAMDSPQLGASLEIGPLAEVDGIEFIRVAAGAATEPWADRDVARLVDAVGGLPLALGVVASGIRSRPAWSATDHASSLADWHGDTRLDAKVDAALAASFESLSDTARGAVKLLAATPFITIADDTLGAMLEVGAEATTAAIDEAVASSMATRPESGRVTLHALVRAFGRKRTLDDDAPSARDAAIGRSLDHLVAVARRAADTSDDFSLPGWRDAYPTIAEHPPFTVEEAATRIGQEFPDLVRAATDGLCQRLRPAVALELCEALIWFAERNALHEDFLEIVEHAVAAARMRGDETGEMLVELAAARSLLRIGDHNRARESLDRTAALTTDEERLEMRVQNVRGMLEFQSGDIDAARRALLASVELAERVGTPGELARGYDNMSILCCRTGEYDKAADFCRRALALIPQIDDPNTAANRYSNASTTLRLAGDLDGALDVAQQALALAEQHELVNLIALARSNVAGVFQHLDRHDEAVTYSEQALAEARRYRSTPTEILMLVNLGHVYLGAGRIDSAARSYEEGLALAEQIDDAYEQGRAHAGLGRVAADRGDLETAEEHWLLTLKLIPAGDETATEVRAWLDDIGGSRDDP